MGRLSTILRRSGVHGPIGILSSKVLTPLLHAICNRSGANRPSVFYRVPGVKFFAVNVFFWGVLEMCMAATSSFGGLFVCRFFLGGCEALLIPAVTLVVSMWYRPEEQPSRNSIILNVIAPILNGFIAWLVSYYHGPFESWKIIFLVLGAFTALWAIVVYLFL